ncbi:MAG: signal peptidase [Actinomycetota bacterium]|jgi:signal peptidase II
MSRRSLLPLATVIVVLDQVTKHWAVNALSDGHTVDVVWTLRFALGFNSGMAFSKATGLGPLIGVIATVAVVWLLSSLRKAGSQLSAVGMALVAGGAAGNVVDRLFRGPGWFRGSVVDFIDLQWWPVFNVADSAITVGGCLLVLGAVLASRNADGAGVIP